MKVEIAFNTLFEFRTPTDNRTRERKLLKNKAKEVESYEASEFGIYNYFDLKNILFMLTFYNN